MSTKMNLDDKDVLSLIARQIRDKSTWNSFAQLCRKTRNIAYRMRDEKKLEFKYLSFSHYESEGDGRIYAKWHGCYTTGSITALGTHISFYPRAMKLLWVPVNINAGIRPLGFGHPPVWMTITNSRALEDYRGRANLFKLKEFIKVFEGKTDVEFWWAEWEMGRYTKEEIMEFPQEVRNVIPEGQLIFFNKDDLFEPQFSTGYLIVNLEATLDELRRVLACCKLSNVCMDPSS